MKNGRRCERRSPSAPKPARAPAGGCRPERRPTTHAAAQRKGAALQIRPPERPPPRQAATAKTPSKTASGSKRQRARKGSARLSAVISTRTKTPSHIAVEYKRVQIPSRHAETPARTGGDRVSAG